MYNKGSINFKLAEYIFNNPINGYQEHELYAVIVNRWYYGLFLMAKSRLAPHKKITHRDYKDNNGKTVCGLWSQLGHHTRNGNIAQKGIALFKYREQLDYYADNPTIEEQIFRQAQKLAGELRKIL